MLRYSSLLIGVAILAVGCGGTPERETETGAAITAAPESTRPAVSVSLIPTTGQMASGTLILRETDDGIRLTGQVSGLPADRELGFHVHEIGDCSAPDASSAGEHFNPDQQPHGEPDDDRSHAGDMPNLDVNDDGVAEVDIELEGVRLDGPADRSVRQRALVVHAQADDYETQPSGGSGERIACGVIGAGVGL